MNGLHAYVGRAVEDLPTPVVVVHAATVERNVADMAEHARVLGVALRPHWKTSKSAEVARRQLLAGAVGLTAATAAEALALADAGAPDIFWAYPPVGSHRLETAIEVRRRARLIVGVDSLAHARPLGDAFESCGDPAAVDVRLDVDTGLGRTGVAPEEAVRVARELSSIRGVRLEGVFTHEGHVQSAGADPEQRRLAGEAAGRLLVEVADAIRAEGIGLVSVSVGSTAGARSAPTVPGITEARPGTYVYGDENQVSIGSMTGESVAVSVLSRVISTERGDPVLIDAGIKAMSSDGSLHGDGRIGTVVSEGGGILALGHEEHGFLRGAVGARLGDLVLVRPNHACGLINMHAQVVVAESGVVTDVWPVLARH